jgi:5-methylcytosine-specific restriction endonuclease McrA
MKTKCNRCGEYKEKVYSAKRWHICPDCLNSGPRDKEKRRARGRKYYNKHPFLRLAKAIKKKDKTSTITAKDLWKIAKKQKLICCISGRKLSNSNISPDHILSKFNGGASTAENIQLVCKEVNVAKHVLSLDELIQLAEDIIKYNNKK